VGGDEKMGVFVAGVPSSLTRRTPFFSRSPSPSPFTPATQAILALRRPKSKLQEGKSGSGK